MIKTNTLRYMARLFLSLLAQAIIFFTAVEQLDLPRAWLFFALAFLYYLTSFIILYWYNPDLIQHWGGSAFRGDSKEWDKYILLIYSFLGVYGQFFVAGWGLGHIQWLYLGWEYLVIGTSVSHLRRADCVGNVPEPLLRTHRQDTEGT